MPGGRLLIADIFASKAYRDRLEARGMLDVQRRNLGWRFWWSGPWVSTYATTAQKPPAAAPWQPPYLSAHFSF